MSETTEKSRSTASVLPDTLYAAVCWPDMDDRFHIYGDEKRTKCGLPMDEFVVSALLTGAETESWCVACIATLKEEERMETPMITPHQIAEELGLSLTELCVAFRTIVSEELASAADEVKRGHEPDFARLRRLHKALKAIDSAWDEENPT
jgi:hypothetical protein